MEIFSFLLVIIVIAIIEQVLSSRWNPFYFRSGLTIYRKELLNQKFSEELLDISKFENLFSKGLAPSMRFRNLSETEIAFREQNFQFSLFSYTPLMHGLIVVNKEENMIILKGKTNWAVLLFFLYFIFQFISPGSIFAGEEFAYIICAVAFGITLLLYSVQAFRFRKITKYLSKQGDEIS